MSVHRIRLHRSAHSASPPAAAPERATAQVRPDLGALLARRLVADRGDVPGWVLITLMTAAIVVALWAVASEQMLPIFNNAMAPFLGKELRRSRPPARAHADDHHSCRRAPP